MKSALFPGIFDPPTLGHVELIRRAATLFEKVYVGVVEASGKRQCSFKASEREALMKKAIGDLANVEVVLVKGLVVDAAKKLHINALVRGLRNGTDFDYEYQMAAANQQMTGIETVFLASAPQYVHLNSTLIREIAANGRRLNGFVPDNIEEAIFKHLYKEH